MIAQLLTLLTAATMQAEVPEQTRTEVADGLYVIMGQGGNILFSTGDDGTFVVDDQFERIAEENLALIREVNDGPIAFVLNTHYHGDHTGGNSSFRDAGAMIVSREAVRQRLMTEDDETGALPVITFEDAANFYWNGQPIRAVALPDAHTDGDAMVYFEGADILHTGDTLFNGRYPYIDVEAGGSIEGMIGALERIMEVAGPNTTIVPGHGPVATEEDVTTTLDMLRAARDAVQARIEAGDSREEAIESDPLDAYNDTYAWAFIDGDKMTGQLYDSLTSDRDGSAQE